MNEALSPGCYGEESRTEVMINWLSDQGLIGIKEMTKRKGVFRYLKDCDMKQTRELLFVAPEVELASTDGVHMKAVLSLTLELLKNGIGCLLKLGAVSH